MMTLMLACRHNFGNVSPTIRAYPNGISEKSARGCTNICPIARQTVAAARPKSDIVGMGKIGRNAPCTCGSGKKFKHCHGSATPSAGPELPPEIWAGIERKRQEIEALQRRRQQQQGLGRPIISEQVSTQRVVAVGRRLYHSTKWQTFHDFLRDYLLGSLGPEWANSEQAKPVEKRHPILRWYAQASEQAKAMQLAEGTMISGPMTGAIRAFMNLA